MRGTHLAFTVLVLAGCAANSGIVQTGENAYFISRQAATGFGGLGTLRADAMEEAYAECRKTGRSVEVTSTKETRPPYIVGNYPRVDIEFRCVEADE